jgi:hypothetical protein
VESIRTIPEVDDVFVHIDPKELDEWKDDPETDRLAGIRPDGEGGDGNGS